MDYVGRADFARTMVRPSLPILSCRRCARREQQTEKRGHLKERSPYSVGGAGALVHLAEILAYVYGNLVIPDKLVCRCRGRGCNARACR
jgi:hypothetical protein